VALLLKQQLLLKKDNILKIYFSKNLVVMQRGS